MGPVFFYLFIIFYYIMYLYKSNYDFSVVLDFDKN